MFNNYLKIAWRTIWNNKIFSGINILGLSLGLTSSMLILMWVQDELKFDAFHEKLDRIFIVTGQEYIDGEVRGSYETPGSLGDELVKTIPEVELASTSTGSNYLTFASGEKKRNCVGYYAGKDYFKIFTYPMIEGSVKDALNDPDNIAISENMAIYFFSGAHEAIGQYLKIENDQQLKVSAVFRDVPSHSTESFEFVLPWEKFEQSHPWVKEWHTGSAKTFVLLKTRNLEEKVDSKIRDFISPFDKAYKKDDHLELALQPFRERYLHSNFKNGKIDGGRIEYVRLFGFVALFILLVACINFMNLSTARSLHRAREIGVRKVVGALKSSLIYQFMGEALLYTVIAVCIALIFLGITLPAFNQLTSKSMILPFGQFNFWLSLVLLTTMTGLIAGSYPALLMSSFRPIMILKNTLRLSPASGWMRKGLVVFQFVLSIVFINSMLTISRQVEYIQTKNLGYEKANLIYLPVKGTLSTNFSVFKEAALKIPGVNYITQMSQRPIEVESVTGAVKWRGKDPNTQPRFTHLVTDYDFITTMQAELVSGRDFSMDYSDSANYLINESALNIIGYNEPIGQPLTFWGVKGTIVGVIRDFHFHSFHVPIQPLIMRLVDSKRKGYAMIRYTPGQSKSVLEGLKQVQQSLNPEFPFAPQFADEEYNAMYVSEGLVKSLTGLFTLLAIIISCLGLFGLSIFSAEQRTKEIGIRKVLGASIVSLFRLLSKDFLGLVGMAFLIATPIAWAVMNQWLDDYAYKIVIGWSIYLLAGLAAMGIALMTVSYQAFKTSRANLVRAIRT